MRRLAAAGLAAVILGITGASSASASICHAAPPQGRVTAQIWYWCP